MIPSQSFVVQLVAAAGIALAADPDIGASRAAVHAVVGRRTDGFGHGHLRPARRRLARSVGGPEGDLPHRARGRRNAGLARPGHLALPARCAAATQLLLHCHRRRSLPGHGREPARAALHLHVPGARTQGAGGLAGGAERSALGSSRRTAGSIWCSTPPPTRPPWRRTAYLEFDNVCPAPGVIRLQGRGRSGPINDKDRWDIREAGGWDRDRSADRLRRVVTLAPRTPLPKGCTGHLVLPSAFDERGRADLLRWEFATYGSVPPRCASTCGWERQFCPNGPVVLHFSTPVRGAEVQRNVALRPAVAFVGRRYGGQPRRVGAARHRCGRTPATRSWPIRR